MKRGPKPKSEAERELQGRPSHHAKKPAPLPGANLPTAEALTSPVGKPPQFLNAKEREAWDLAAPALHRLNMLTDADVMGFARYVGWLSRYFELTKSTRRSKIVEKTAKKSGKMDRLDKGFTALLMIDKRLQEYEDRFGMNPRERQALLARLADGVGRRPAAPPPSEPPANEPRPAASGPVGGLRSASTRLQ